MKRRTLMIAGALSLGAVINVAVAWSSAMATDLRRGTMTELYAKLSDEHHWEVYRWNHAAGTRIFSKCWSGLASGPFNHGDPGELLASWGRIERPGTAPPSGAEIDEGWGLPLRSMSLHTVATRDDGGAIQTMTSAAIRLRKPQGFTRRGILLPLLPAWRGFVFNTIVYALAVVVIRAAVRDITRAIRRQRAPVTA